MHGKTALLRACFRRPGNRPQRSFGQIVVFTITFPAISKTKRHCMPHIAGEMLFYIIVSVLLEDIFFLLYAPSTTAVSRNSIIRAIPELFEIIG